MSSIVLWKDNTAILSMGQTDVSGVSNVDRISYLPAPIKHDILSRLDTREAVQTCVLSKAWRHEWMLMPTLIFDQQFLPDDVPRDDILTYSVEDKCRLQEILGEKEAFFKFIDRVLQKRASSKESSSYTLQKLSIYLPFSRVDIALHVDKWIADAEKCGLKKLQLDGDHYQLPNSVLYASFLTCLKLSSCKIKQIKLEMIRLSSLLKLSLVNVHVNEQTLRGIITSCCAMKKLSLLFCSGFGKIEVSGAPKLEEVKVSDRQKRGLKVVVSKAMRLQAFTFKGDFHKSDQVNVATCKNIRHLRLDSVVISDEQLSFHLSELQFLEELSLSYCETLRSVRISAANLKYLSLIYCRKVLKAKIDAPKLESFNYSADNIIPLSLDVPSLACAVVSIQFENKCESCLVKLIDFLTTFNCFTTVTLRFLNPNMNNCFPEELRRMHPSPLWKVRHIKAELCIRDVLYSLAETIETILWLSPRPESITIPTLPMEPSSDINKTLKFHFTYNELSDNQEEEEHSCCSSIKCWRHSLKEVKVDNLTDCETTAKLKDLFETSETLESIEGLSTIPYLSFNHHLRNLWLELYKPCRPYYSRFPYK